MTVGGKKWITREKAKVDRIACPWLIKRFVDSNPEFLFVPADKVLEIGKAQNAVPFDIPNGDPAVLELARIVKAADTNKKELATESVGLEAIAEGFGQITKDDFDNMSKQFYVYDALYAYCKAKISQKTGGL
jgi:hypothetical protein